ncbi:HNH endonuclease [Microbacterium sp. cx-55]|uniref:HNH endonuclease signature motif containing protein n=1 Tax=Microbacterium sp. cx-55 TaxID=2875948 RepID=UPI001CBFCE67|nr:HNH endonuclease signature motif containing protein [Microbacterium sp. cx-55]UGB35544.1 HNH endonuclease [Microbacterium sp. cx-55]
MFFDSSNETDAAWGADPDEFVREDDYLSGRDDWAPPAPDPLEGVLEVTGMMAIMAAQRCERVYGWRHEVLRAAERTDRMSREMAERSLRLELACAMRITEAAASRVIDQAVALLERYPAALRALASAAITERHADVLVDALDPLEPALRDRILPRALELAETQPVGTFRRQLRALVERMRADTLSERRARAVTGRRVVVESAEDGMAWLMALIPAVEARAAHGRLTAMATALRASEDETRTLDQLRADALGDLLIDGTADVHSADVRGIRATVTVTVPALTLLAENGVSPEGPAVVEGVGPIPIETARELCGGSADWMRVLTHPETGVVLSVGRDRYRPPKSLRDVVTWRAGRCMAPGCGMPSARCQIDHSIPWVEGGITSLANLAPLCEGHHTVKHHGGWTITQIRGSGGALEWTSPAGRRYVVPPERPMPFFRVGPADLASSAPF